MVTFLHAVVFVCAQQINLSSFVSTQLIKMIRPLIPELQEKSEKELKEVPNRIQDDLTQFKEWLQKQPHLCTRTDDQWLVGFLRGCKFSLERAKEKIDNFYTIRTLVPEFFGKRNLFRPQMQELLDAGAIFPLPNTEKPGDPRIVLYRVKYCNSEDINFVDMCRLYFLTMDVLMNEDDNCMVAGLRVWVDFKDFPLSGMLQFTPALIKKCVMCIQSAYPIRISQIYFSNAPPFIEAVFNLCKSFMSEKLQKRMAFCGEKDFHRIYEDIPQTIMPEEYGGNAGSIKELAAAYKAKVESYKEWFLEEVRYCSDENLRPGKPKTGADMFGVEGTFRKLTID